MLSARGIEGDTRGNILKKGRKRVVLICSESSRDSAKTREHLNSFKNIADRNLDVLSLVLQQFAVEDSFPSNL